MTPTALYLHGFASGPASHKGTWLRAHFSARGLPLRLMNLRLPSLEHLRFSAILGAVDEAVTTANGPVVLLGSSLGGLAAAHIAARRPEVVATVLLAPAFGLVRRWRERQPDVIAAWEASGVLETHDYTTGQMTTVDFEFFRDISAVTPEEPEVHVPTLIVHGVADDTVPVAHSRAYAATRPHVRLVEVTDGHELSDSLPRIAEEAEAHLQSWWRPTG